MKNEIIPYRKDLKEKARELRKNSTLAEVLLWTEIKDRRICGYQFHRQVPMLYYIVDFYCHELKLAIEIDGDSHDQKVGYDAFRQRELEHFGVRFIRFDDLEVKQEIKWVLDELFYKVHELSSYLKQTSVLSSLCKHPSGSPQGENLIVVTVPEF